MRLGVVTSPWDELSARPPPSPAGALIPSAAAAGAKRGAQDCISRDGQHGRGHSCRPGLLASLPGTGLALQKEDRAGSQPVATSPPCHRAGSPSTKPRPLLSIAPFTLKWQGLQAQRGGSRHRPPGTGTASWGSPHRQGEAGGRSAADWGSAVVRDWKPRTVLRRNPPCLQPSQSPGLH